MFLETIRKFTFTFTTLLPNHYIAPALVLIRSIMELTRREAALGGASVVLGGSTLAALASRPTTAEVSSDLSVSGSTYSSADGNPFTPWVLISGTWEFQANTHVDQWRVRLFVSSDGTDWSVLAADGGPADAKKLSGSYSLKAPLVKHSAWTGSDFQANEGNTKTEKFYVRIEFAALDAEDNTITSAAAADSVQIEITNESVKATGTVTGSGETKWQESENGTPPA